MTIPQAIAELEDRGVPEVVELLFRLQLEIDRKDREINELNSLVDKLKYGDF